MRFLCARALRPNAVLFFGGSEAFFLRYVLGLGEGGLGSLLGRILCRVVLLLVRVEVYPN